MERIINNKIKEVTRKIKSAWIKKDFAEVEKYINILNTHLNRRNNFGTSRYQSNPSLNRCLLSGKVGVQN